MLLRGWTFIVEGLLLFVFDVRCHETTNFGEDVEMTLHLIGGDSLWNRL